MKTTVAVAGTLSATERYALKKHKQKITDYAKAYIRALPSVIAIRDQRLYRDESETFNEFCQKNWGWTARWVNMLIESHTTVSQLPEDLGTKVPNVAAARAISKVPKGKRAAVIAAVAAEGPVTAKAIADEAAKEDIELDETGFPIPKERVALWARRTEVQEYLTSISKSVNGLKDCDPDDPLWGTMHVQEAVMSLDKAWHTLALHKPYAVCVICQGHPETQPNGDCRGCKGTGFMGKYTFRIQDRKLIEIREKMCKV